MVTEGRSQLNVHAVASCGTESTKDRDMSLSTGQVETGHFDYFKAGHTDSKILSPVLYSLPDSSMLTAHKDLQGRIA